MKIIENRPERLVLQRRPWLLAGILVLSMLIGAGFALWLFSTGEVWAGLGVMAGEVLMLGMVLIFVRRTIVFFDRAADAVLIREASAFGQTEERHKLSNLRGAEVEVSSASGEDSTDTYRVALVFADGTRLPLTAVYVSGGGSDRAVRAINAWLGG